MPVDWLCYMNRFRIRRVPGDEPLLGFRMPGGWPP